MKEVDAVGLLCPAPIMKLSKAIKEADVGECVKVVATDMGFVPDVKAWCKGTKHELVSCEQDGDRITAEIRRTK